MKRAQCPDHLVTPVAVRRRLPSNTDFCLSAFYDRAERLAMTTVCWREALRRCLLPNPPSPRGCIGQPI